MENAASLRERGISYVVMITFLDAIAASLGISVLPYFVEELGGSPTNFGSLLATFSSFNVVAALWIGTASDRFGRRPLLVLSLFGLATGFFTNATTQSISLLFVARAMIGFFAGIGSTGRAYIGDVCDDPEERTKNITRLGGLTMFGYAFGPPIGSAIALVGDESTKLRMPFYTATLITTVAACFAWARLPSVGEIKAAMEAEAAEAAAAKSKKGGSKAAADKSGAGTSGDASKPQSLSNWIAIGLLLLANALQNVGASCFLLVMPLFIKDYLGWGSPQFAALMTCFVLTMAITQIAIFTPVQKAVGLIRLGIVANVTSAAALCGYTLVNSSSTLSKALFCAVTAVSMLATAFSAPVVNLLVIERASSNLGFAMGLVSTAEQLGRFAAPICLALLYEQIGADAAFYATANCVALAAGCYVVVATMPTEPTASPPGPAGPPAESPTPATAKLQMAVNKLLGIGRVTTAFKEAANEARKRVRTAEINQYVAQGQLADNCASTAVEAYFQGFSPSQVDRERSAHLVAQAAEADAEAVAAAAELEAAESREKAATGGKPLDML